MKTKPSPMEPIFRWRKKNSELCEQRRIAGIRRSQKIKDAAKRNALARVGTWRVRSPQNVIYEFKNLSNFLRDHSNLFHPNDLKQYSLLKPSRYKTTDQCNAYKFLLALKPYRMDGGPKRNVVGSWKGWRWYASKDAEEIG